MNEYDVVRVIVEKQTYAKEGVHKDMVGTILDPRKINGKWLVVFSGEFKQDEDGAWYTTDKECEVAETDLIVVKEYKEP